MCSKDQEFKSILFSLCYFHACVAGRLRFGPQGWSRSYPFSPGDLTICTNILYNYLEANPNVSAVVFNPFQAVRGICQSLGANRMDYRFSFETIIETANITKASAQVWK